MDIRQLEYFLQICEDGSITQAAGNLYISQQGLGKSIARLENELGCSLLNRTSKGIVLTKVGVYFRTQAQRILDIVDESRTFLNIQTSQKPNLLLGCAFGVVGEFANELFDSTAKSNQQINLKIQEFPDKLCETAVANNEIELGLAIGPIDRRQFESHFLFKRRYCLIVHKSHALAQFNNINIEQLKNQKIVVMNENFKAYHILNALCAKKGFAPNFYYKAGEVALIHNLVSKMQGIGLSVDFLTKEMNSLDIKVINVKNSSFVWSVYLINKKHHHLSKEAELFKNSLLELAPFN